MSARVRSVRVLRLILSPADQPLSTESPVLSADCCLGVAADQQTAVPASTDVPQLSVSHVCRLRLRLKGITLKPRIRPIGVKILRAKS